MFSKFAVHAWMQCGGLKQEISMLVPPLKVKSLSMHHKWEEIVDFECKTTNE